MVQRIYWNPPTDSAVGSVLIYRAGDDKLDSLGSRSVVATIASSVTTYQDSTGSVENVYRVQFWDGVGSSDLSDPVNNRFTDYLATHEDVLRLARLNNYDVGSNVVYDAIEDAGIDIYEEYGDPLKKTSFYIDSYTGVKGQSYNFTGDLGPVYQVRRVTVDAVEPDIVPSGSYVIDYANGNIRFTDGFINANQGEYVMVDWVPSIINVMAKNMAALELLEGELVATGLDASNPQVQRIKDKISRAQEHLRPKGVFSQDLVPMIDGYTIVDQALDRTSIYFNK